MDLHDIYDSDLERCKNYEEMTCRKYTREGSRVGIIEKVYRSRKNGQLMAKVHWDGKITYELLSEIQVF